MANQTLKNAHGGFAGPTLIQRIEKQMDKRRKALENMLVQSDDVSALFDSKDYIINTGRYEGLAGALAIMRSSSVTEEVSRSNDRLGIE